ncbi:MAG: hypothetical protein IJH04_10945 [Eggerthellaceae bacterium]|nr:hypothetical protein [Eggerthellaceae bacterium]
MVLQDTAASAPAQETDAVSASAETELLSATAGFVDGTSPTVPMDFAANAIDGAGATEPIGIDPGVSDALFPVDPTLKMPNPLQASASPTETIAREASEESKQAAAQLVMHDVEAPAAMGEVVLSSWQEGPAADAVATQTGATGSQEANWNALGDGGATGAAQSFAQDAFQGAGASDGPSVHYASEVEMGAQASQKSKTPSMVPRIIAGLVAVGVIAAIGFNVIPPLISQPTGFAGSDASKSAAIQSATASSAAKSSTAASSSASATSALASSVSAAASASASSTSSKSAAASSSSAAASTVSSASASSAAASAAASKSAASASASSTAPSSSAAVPPAADPVKSAAASSPAASVTYSTSEPPSLQDFLWLTGDAMKGNVPDGAKRMVDFGSLVGGWKAYMFGDGMEWFISATVDAGQSGAVVSFDWIYMFDGSAGEGRDDDTPTSTFSGTFDGGMLDAVGSGRITLAAFWQQGNSQYATGSFMWPDGTVCTVALVRP